MKFNMSEKGANGVGQFFSLLRPTPFQSEVARGLPKEINNPDEFRLHLLVCLEHFVSLLAVEHFVVIFDTFWDRITLEWLSFQKWHFFSLVCFFARLLEGNFCVTSIAFFPHLKHFTVINLISMGHCRVLSLD